MPNRATINEGAAFIVNIFEVWKSLDELEGSKFKRVYLAFKIVRCQLMIIKHERLSHSIQSTLKFLEGERVKVFYNNEEITYVDEDEDMCSCGCNHVIQSELEEITDSLKPPTIH